MILHKINISFQKVSARRFFMKKLINEILEDVGLEKINTSKRELVLSNVSFVTRDIKEILNIIVNGKK
jgi:hypothetical protein